MPSSLSGPVFSRTRASINCLAARIDERDPVLVLVALERSDQLEPADADRRTELAVDGSDLRPEPLHLVVAHAYT